MYVRFMINKILTQLDIDGYKYILEQGGTLMPNPDLKIVPREDIDMVEILVEETFVCEITPDGESIVVNNVALSIEDIEFIALKAREIQKHGRIPPTCEFCGGTPFFPNEKPATPQWEQHICKNHIHTRQV